MLFESKTRGAGACTQCGNVFAVRQSTNGTVRPIGTAACSCGSTSFRVLEQ